MSDSRSSRSENLSRREFIQSGGAAAAFTAAMGMSKMARGTDDQRPNILFLMDDQHRGDCLGADGNDVIKTPHMDRLAAEGACFHSAYSSLPSCTPARTSILTGQSPWNHGMLGYSQVANEYPFEMPRALQALGYYTAVIGKNHFSPQREAHGYQQLILDESGREQSIDFRSDYRSWLYSIDPHVDPDATGVGWNSYRAKPYVLPEDYHPTHWTGDTAVEFLEGYNGDEPFFLKVSFARPHSPYDPPQRFFDLYRNAPLPEAYVGDWSNEWYGSYTKETPYNLARGNLGQAQIRRSRQGYYGSISFIDEQVGRIINALARRGLMENTLILFTSDHGDQMGDHHLWRKTYAYEGSARVPMIVRWPEGMVETERGQHIQEPVELRDIAPTFLEAARSTVPESVDGGSMLELIRGNRENWRDYIDLEHSTTYFDENAWTALANSEWKYIYHAYTGDEQLFDLEEDPGETQDLSTVQDYQRTLETWRGRMIDHLAERGEPWVVDGELGIRKERITLGPNYPEA